MTRECKGPRAQSNLPRFVLPELTCDCHVHVFGPFDRFPLDEERSYTPPEASLADLIAFHDRMRIERSVIVLPTPYGTQNDSLLDALEHHPDRFRGIAVVSDETSESMLDRMTDLGVRGIRVNLLRSHGAATFRNGIGFVDLLRIAPRLAARGWHAQIFISAEDIAEIETKLLNLPLDIVFDHMGRPQKPEHHKLPGFETICRLLREERAWCKLSGVGRNSLIGPPYGDVDPIALKLIDANVNRLVWGSDWPHVAYFDKDVPDDGELLNLVARWLPDQQLRKKVLSENPARLYGF